MADVVRRAEHFKAILESLALSILDFKGGSIRVLRLVHHVGSCLIGYAVYLTSHAVDVGLGNEVLTVSG